MHISDRFAGAMLPWGEPLPVLTNGKRTHDDTYANDVRMLGHAVDATATALVRPFGAMVVAASGAAKMARAKPSATALSITCAGAKGVGSGALVGISGAVVGLGEALVIDVCGSVCMLSVRTCGLAISGISAGIKAVFRGDA